MSVLWWVIVGALILFAGGLLLLVFAREYAVWLRATRRGNDVDLVGVRPRPHVHSFPLSTGVCKCGEEHPVLGPPRPSARIVELDERRVGA